MLLALALIATLLSAAIFGFFYAWVCSTMWGLDAAAPKTAIAAMQAMNASVRNAVFAPAFFATGPALLLTALLARQTGAGLWFAAAGLVYLAGGMALTIAVNVPMNEALAALDMPADPAEAAQVWADYSGPWQLWNQIRTGFSGLAFVLAAIGLYRLGAAHGGCQGIAEASAIR